MNFTKKSLILITFLAGHAAWADGVWGLAQTSSQSYQLACVSTFVPQYLYPYAGYDGASGLVLVSADDMDANPIPTGTPIDPKYCKDARLFVVPMMTVYPDADPRGGDDRGIKSCQPFGVANAVPVPYSACEHLATWRIDSDGNTYCSREDAAHPGQAYSNIQERDDFCIRHGKPKPKGVWSQDSQGKHACYLEDSAHPGKVADAYKGTPVQKYHCKTKRFVQKEVISKGCEVLFPALREKYDAFVERNGATGDGFDKCVTRERELDRVASKQVDEINASITGDPAIISLRESSKEDAKLVGTLVNWIREEKLKALPQELSIWSVGADQIILASQRLHYSIDYSGNSPAVESSVCDQQFPRKKIMSWEAYKLENLDPGCKSVIEVEEELTPPSTGPVETTTPSKVVGS